MYFVVHEYWRDDSLNRINESNTAVGQQAALCVCVCWVGADSTNLKICLMWHSAYLEMFYIFFFHIHGIYYDVTVMSSHQSTMSCYMRFTHTHPTNWSHRYYFIIIISITCCMWWCYTHTTHTFPQRKSIQEPCEIEFERERESIGEFTWDGWYRNNQTIVETVPVCWCHTA